MSEFNKYSTDGGATFIDVEDTNGRTMSEQLTRDTVGWTGKNLGKPLIGVAATGDPSTGYSIMVNNNSLCYIAEIKNGKSYTVTKKSGQGNRFRVILFNNYPTTTSDMTANQIVFNNDLNEYTFTNTTYKYALFGVSSNGGDNPDTIEGMICLATISDDIYEPYHDNVTDIQRKYNACNVLRILNTSETLTYAGITYSVDDEDSSITLSGTSSASNIYIFDTFRPKAGTYIFSSKETSQPSKIHYFVDAMNGNTKVRTLGEISNTDHIQITIDYSDYDSIKVAVWIDNGVNLSTPVTAYPSLIPTDLYVDEALPPAKSNYELSKRIRLSGITVDGTIATEISANNSFIIPAYHLAVISVKVKIGTYTNWGNILSGLPSSVIRSSLSALNETLGSGLSAIVEGSNIKLISSPAPSSGNNIIISGSYIYT